MANDQSNIAQMESPLLDQEDDVEAQKAKPNPKPKAKPKAKKKARPKSRRQTRGGSIAPQPRGGMLPWEGKKRKIEVGKLAKGAKDHLISQWEAYFFLGTALVSIVDLATDLYVAIVYLTNEKFSSWWGILAISITAFSGVLTSLFEWYAGDKRVKLKYVILNLTHLRVPWAALRAAAHKLFGLFTSEDATLDLSLKVRELKAWEAFFESGPQLLLQTYVMVVLLPEKDAETGTTFVSFCISAGSIAIAALTFEVDLISPGFEPSIPLQGMLVFYHFCVILFSALAMALFAVCYGALTFLAMALSFSAGCVIFYTSAIIQNRKKISRAEERGESIEDLQGTLATLTDSRLWGYPLFGFFTSSLVHRRHRPALNVLFLKNLVVAIGLFAAAVLNGDCHLDKKKGVEMTKENYPDQFRNRLDLHSTFTLAAIYLCVALWMVSVLLGAILKLIFKFKSANAQHERTIAAEATEAEEEEPQELEETDGSETGLEGAGPSEAL